MGYINQTRHHSSERAAVLNRLDAIIPQIETIRAIFKTPSLSIGVYYKGAEPWTKGFGYANLETRQVPNSKTVYCIGSCTKGFTGTALSLLAHRGVVDLDAPVSAKIPSLKTEGNPIVAEKMTTRDMLSHCVGLSTLPAAVLGRNGSVFAEHKDIIQIFNHLPREAEFKSEWMYNNWLFALAGRLIAQETQSSFGQFVQKEIFDNLGMRSTYTNGPPNYNHALPYLIFDKKPPQVKGLPHLIDGVAFDSSGSIRSSVDDLLLWSRKLMQAWRDANRFRRNHTKLTPSRDPSCLSFLTKRISIRSSKELSVAMAEAQKPHFPLARDPKQNYALGLFHLNLPTTEMNLVTNSDINSRTYSIGKDSGNRLVIGHTGELGGFLSAYWTFPEEDCSIVVLCNSFQINGDPTNIIAQLLAQTIFDMKPAVNFVEVAKNVVRNAKGRWDLVIGEWTSYRMLNTFPQEVSAHIGDYYNEDLAMRLSVTLNKKASCDLDMAHPLVLCINGNEEQVFELSHYHNNSWTFMQPTRDECIEKGYSMYLLYWRSFIIDFDILDHNQFGKIRWTLDFDERVEAQVFLRK